MPSVCAEGTAVGGVARATLGRNSFPEDIRVREIGKVRCEYSCIHFSLSQLMCAESE